MIQDPIAILSVLLATVLVSLHLAARYEWAKKASPVILIIFGAAVCSNLGLIPTDLGQLRRKQPGAIAVECLVIEVLVHLVTEGEDQAAAAPHPFLEARHPGLAEPVEVGDEDHLILAELDRLKIIVVDDLHDHAGLGRPCRGERTLHEE